MNDFMNLPGVQMRAGPCITSHSTLSLGGGCHFNTHFRDVETEGGATVSLPQVAQPFGGRATKPRQSRRPALHPNPVLPGQLPWESQVS